MQGREGKIVIESPLDIINNLSDDFKAPASGYVKVYSDFFTRYISKLADVYLKYLDKKANKEDIEKIYKEYKKEIDSLIENKNALIKWQASKSLKEETINEFWKDKQGKRNINIYSTSYCQDSKFPNLMFFVLRKDFYEEVEEYVNRFCERLDEIERGEIRYRLIRIILNINTFKEVLQNIEEIKKHIENIPNLQLKEAIEFLKEFERIDEYVKSVIERGLKGDDRRILRIIDKRLNLINFNLYLWSDEEEDADEIVLRRPVLGRISVGDKKLRLIDVVLKELKEDKNIKDAIKYIYNNYKEEERRKELYNIVETFLSIVPFNMKMMLLLVYRERNYRKDRNMFLRTLDHIIGAYLELMLTKKIKSKIFEIHNYYKNQIVASVRDVKVETKSATVYILYSDEKASRELVDLLTGNYKNKKGGTPIRNKNKLLVGTNTSPKVSEEKKDIFIANVSFIENLDELSKFERPYALNIRDLFLHYNQLKEIEDKEKETWDENSSIWMLFLIISANALFIALENHAKRNNTQPLLFACIDTNTPFSERQTYAFWDVVKAVARTNLFPLQTYQSVVFPKKEKEKEEEKTGIRQELKSQIGVGLQNLLFSSTRNLRKVKMKWDIKELNLSQKWDNNSLTVYLIVENRTSMLFEYSLKNIRAKFYEIFELNLTKEGRTVNLEIGMFEDKETGRKTFFSFGWDESTVGEIEKIINKLREKTEYVFLLTLDREILEKKLDNAYKVFVRSVISPLLIEQLSLKTKDANALILHRKELLKFTELIKDSLTRAVFGVHSIIPSSFLPKKLNLNKGKQKQLFEIEEKEKKEKYERFEKIIGSELNLFWIDERIYDNPADTDIFVISILSWLIFETDTSSHPYVKPRWIKRKNGHLILPMFYQDQKIITKFDTTALVFELSELVSVYKGLSRYTGGQNKRE